MTLPTDPNFDQPYASPQAPTAPSAPQKVPVTAHLMCGWPLFLVAIGGLVGGALGGGAYAINLQIYKSALPVPLKIVLNLLTGLAAAGIWLAVGVVIVLLQQ